MSATKNEYFYQGPKDFRENTGRVDMGDGRAANVGEKIELTDAEAELLRSTGSKLRAVSEPDSEDDSPQGDTDSGNLSEKDSK